MANIKIKLGVLELDCEGPEEFLKAEVPVFLKLALETQAQLPSTVIPAVPAPSCTPNANGNGAAIRGDAFQGTTETIAAKLGIKKSPDLALAAAARLTFVEGKESFSYDEILTEMKTAKGYFKSHHRANLRRSLQNLIKSGQFNGIATDVFALTASSKADIQGRLHASA